MYNTATAPPPPPKTTAPPASYSHAYNEPPALPPHPERPLSQVAWQDPHQSQPQIPQRPVSQVLGQQYGYEAPARFEQAQPQQHQQYPQQARLPQEGWLPQILLDKSKPELQTILADPALITALLHSTRTAHPVLATTENAVQPLLTANIALAQSILSKQATLTTLRDRSTQHLLSVRALDQQWKKKQAELERKLEPWSARELHQRLGAAIVEGEAVCTGLEESFLDGDGAQAGERETSEWVRRVREARKLVALRRERKARWDEGRVGGWR